MASSSTQSNEGRPLWPGHEATLVSFPVEQGRGGTVVVCPGGAYSHLAEHEGAPVARWLNTLGINAHVLHYRLGPKHRHPAMLEDVRRAIRLARRDRLDRGLDTGPVGVLGFSAGGHLSACACTLYTEGNPDAEDPAERLTSRPDAGVLLYPVISLVDSAAHAGSMRNLLGDAPDPSLPRKLSPHLHVTAKTPPAFLFHTSDDPAVPVENSLLYAAALRSAGVPFELHCFEHGRHGVGMAEDDPTLHAWVELCGRWLKAKGF